MYVVPMLVRSIISVCDLLMRILTILTIIEMEI